MYNDSYWATHDDELQNISTLAQELAASPAFNSSIGWKIQKDWDAAVNSLQRQGISPNDPTYKYRLYAQFNKEAEQSTSVLLFAGGEGLAAIKEFISARNAILAIKGPGKAGTLSNVEARKWYLEQEAKIAGQIDKSLSLEQQAKQAFELRNQYRTEARELMADRKLAEQLNVSDPNRTWEEIVKKTKDKGLSGDDVWSEIIESSMRSRQSVNKSLGLE